MNIPGVSSGNTIALSSGLSHLMAGRTNELGTALGTPGVPRPRFWAALDLRSQRDPSAARQHYNGYGIAGYRFQHPEGGGLTPPAPIADVTENRWHRLFGLVEVPTRSHRELEEPQYMITAGTLNGPLGFYRTPGKINLNTVRHPDVLAGLLDESDIYALNFSAQYPAGQNFTSGLSMPLSLPDQNGLDTFPVALPTQVTSPMAGQLRDWWLQFITARDGIDPLPTANGGTNLPLPGLPRYPSGTSPRRTARRLAPGLAVPPGSHPFRGAGFSAYANAPSSTTGGEDASTAITARSIRPFCGLFRAIRSLSPTPATPANTPDGRRRIFEVGTSTEHWARRRCRRLWDQEPGVVEDPPKHDDAQQRVLCVDPGRLLPGSRRQSSQRSGPHRWQTGDVAGVSRILCDRPVAGPEPDAAAIFAGCRSNDTQIRLLVQSIL